MLIINFMARVWMRRVHNIPIPADAVVRTHCGRTVDAKSFKILMLSGPGDPVKRAQHYNRRPTAPVQNVTLFFLIDGNG